MDDVTDTVFRDIIAITAKPDVLFTEFTSIDGLFSRNREKVIRKLYYSEIQRPVVAQIWGSNAEKFAEAAKLVENLGFDGVDINMGCPDHGVMKSGAGASLINKYDLVRDITKSVQNAVPYLPLSIKTRLASTQALTEQWLEFLFRLNVQAITLHARTAKDMSKVDANWGEIEKAVEIKNKVNPNVILIGNGDIKNYHDSSEKAAKYKVDGGMIGRGIFQDPWAFEKTSPKPEHTSKERLELLAKHTQLFNQKWGTSKHFEIMKKFFKIYIKGFDSADDLRKQLMSTKHFNEAWQIIEANIQL